MLFKNFVVKQKKILNVLVGKWKIKFVLQFLTQNWFVENVSF